MTQSPTEPTPMVERRVGNTTFYEEAVPLPFYSGFWIFTRYGCHCGQKFKTEQLYEHHYIKWHTEES